MLRRLRRPGDSKDNPSLLGRFWREDTAQDLLEYALVAALIGLMTTATLAPVAQVLNNTVDKVHKKFKEHVDHGLHKGWYK